jgi:hypothetical protein
MNIIG